MPQVATKVKLHTRDDPQWEQVVFAEMLIPETPNVYNDYWTKEGIKEAAYEFMRVGFGIDINHDNVDVSGAVYVVETFIVRAGDTDFIEGSWVVAMKIEDAAIWQDILDKKLNGYSYEALIQYSDAILLIEDDGVRQGSTEPDDTGHVHAFMVMVDINNRPITGGTDTVDGHEHTITYSTVTDEADGHSHRYNLVTGKNGV